MWIRGRSDCGIVHHHALEGVGYYIALAKHQGLLPLVHHVIVGTHSPSPSRMYALEKQISLENIPVQEYLLVGDFLRRRAIELSVRLLLGNCERQ